MDVPISRPMVGGREYEYVRQVIDGGVLSADGSFSVRCSNLLEKVLGCPRVLLTTTGTHALELSALLLDVGPQDEVIVPAFTFTSTANAFALRGARVLFSDIRYDTLNMDEQHLVELLSERTRAIVPVHYAGVACEMDAIRALANRHNCVIVEDNAHGLFARYRGGYLGTFGALAAVSFHQTKNLTCGEGGALLVNDAGFLARAEVIRDKGTNRMAFLEGKTPAYTWVDIGSSYGLSDLLAAFLLAQLESREEILMERRRCFDRYQEELSAWAKRADISLPRIPPHCESSYHIYFLLMPTRVGRDRFIEHMRSRGIQASFHYQALNSSPMGKALGNTAGSCPVAEDVVSRVVRLPLFSGLTQSDQDRVIEAATSFTP